MSTPRKAAVKKPARPATRNNPTKNLKAAIALMGNKFWELRSKHGRDKIFETPKIMWAAACEYFTWCANNPLIEIDYKGKDADIVYLPKMRAFTLGGLCLYFDINTGYFTDFEASIKDKNDDISKGFSLVIKKIKQTIYEQKFGGAAAGFLNANIISRDLGLVDKKEIETRDIELTDAERDQKILELQEKLNKSRL